MTQSQTSDFVVEALRKFWFVVAAAPLAAFAIYHAMGMLFPPVYTGVLDVTHPPELSDPIAETSADFMVGITEFTRDGETRTVVKAAGPNLGEVTTIMEDVLTRLRSVAEARTGLSNLDLEQWSAYITAIQVWYTDGYHHAHNLASALVWSLFGSVWLALFLYSLRRPRDIRKP